MTKIFSLLTVLLLGLQPTLSIAETSTPFQVNAIRIVGLNGISEEAVRRQLPIKAGELLDAAKSEDLLKRLHATGWFEAVHLAQKGALVEIVVTQRPTISKIIHQDIDQFPAEELNKLLEQHGLVQGEFFNASNLEMIKKALLVQYKVMGHPKARISTEVIPQSNGTVKILINIYAGEATRLTGLKLLGVSAFQEDVVKAELPITTVRHPLKYVWSIILGKSSVCTPMTRMETLKAITRFYQNRGYCDIQVKTNRLLVTADYSEVDWIIELIEGPQYKVSDYRMVSTQSGLTQDELKSLMHFKAGDIYSAKAVTQTKKAIENHLSEAGYIEAKVTITPYKDTVNHQIAFAIEIDRGPKTYIRRIDVIGNRHLNQKVVRKLLVQSEGSIASKQNLEESEYNLLSSQLVKHVDVKKDKVPNTHDQVDLRFHIQDIDPKIQTNPINMNTTETGISFGSQLKLDNFFGSGEDYYFNVDAMPTKEYTSKQLKLEIGYTNHFLDLLGFRNVKYDVKAHFLNRHMSFKDAYEFFNQSPYLRSIKDHGSWFSDTMASFYTRYFEKEVLDSDQKALGKVTDKSKKQSKSKVTAEEKEKQRKEKRREERGERPEFDYNSLGVGMDVEIPTGIKGYKVVLGLNVRERVLEIPKDETAQILEDFLENYGKIIDQCTFRVGYRYSHFKGRYVTFPMNYWTSNLLLNVSVGGASQGRPQNNQFNTFLTWIKEKQSLNYFKFDYSGACLLGFSSRNDSSLGGLGLKWQLGVGKQWALPGHSLKDNKLPILDTYHSGRFFGYYDDSLGPRDNQNYLLGGNLLIKATGMFFLPKPFSGKYAIPSLSTSIPYRSNIFVQAGDLYADSNIWSNRPNRVQSSSSTFPALPFKLSAGFALEVGITIPFFSATPIPFFVSYARPYSYLSGEEDLTKMHSYWNWGIGFSSS